MFTKKLAMNANTFKGIIWLALPPLTYCSYYLSKSICYSKHYYLKYNALCITNIILVEDIHNDSNKC